MKRLVVVLAAAVLFLGSCGPQLPSFGESWTPSPGRRRQRDQMTRLIEREAN